MFDQLLTIIPPEALAALITGALVGSGYLFRKWFLSKLEAERVKLKQLIEDAAAARERDKIEAQAQAQAQNGNQEMVRLLAAQLTETHRDGVKQLAAMTEATAKRDEQYTKHLATIGDAMQSYQVLSASNFELLKNHIGTDEAMAKTTEIVKDQNEVTHRKLIEMSITLDTIALNLAALTDTMNQKADKSVLSDLLLKLENIQDGIKQLEENTKPMPTIFDAPKIETVTEAVNTVSIETKTTETKTESE